MEKLLNEIKKCEVCLPFLDHGLRPVLSASKNAKIAIVGQAPGIVVHHTGKPWDDKSGERLRDWLGVNEDSFYNKELFALIPMGFCYPGKGKSGDLPPRKECAPIWHNLLFEKMINLELIILIGTYAQEYYLKDKRKKSLTETVRNYRLYLPSYFVLPHPSPRNNIWIKKNPWFQEEVISDLKDMVNPLVK